MIERKEIPYAPGYEIDTQGVVYFNIMYLSILMVKKYN